LSPGKIIGRVIASKKSSTLEGSRLLLLQPTDWKGNPSGDPLVAIDAVGTGAEGEFVFYVSAREAAVAVDTLPPVDAAIVGIIDGVNLEDEG
jgi:ethanolamine utilization protein EutN